MDETVEETAVTVGQRLREAREAKKMSIEDVAASTRIPTRHLNSLELGEWDKLPAPTYSVGFAKNYASAVGLDRDEIGEALRAEMGGYRPVTTQVEVFETADPARTMPKGLIVGALVALALVVAGLMWVRSQSLKADPVAEPVANEVAAPAPAAPAPSSAGPVLVTATQPVWIEIRDGQAILKQGEMTPGDRFEVPLNAIAPTLTTGKPEALQIVVGQTTIAPIGPAGKRVSDVSLKGEDLLKAGTAPATTAAPSPVTSAPAPKPAAKPSAPRAAKPAPAPTQAPAAEPATSPAPAPSNVTGQTE